MTGPVTTPFGPTSTAADVIAGVDLSGRRAVVTGASSGIGIETARALASAGAEVTLAVRDPAAGEAIARSIDGRTAVQPLDLADPGSIAAFVAGWSGPLHILVNNAGVMSLPRTLTAAGWEMHFAVNHLGHFGLALGLHPALVAAGGARVVSLSSSEHQGSPVVFDDVNFARRPYDMQLAYAQSKTANALFAVGADARWSGDGIRVNAVHPGVIHTNLMRRIDPGIMERVKADPSRFWKNPEQGAATSVLVAASPLLEGVGGRYFEDANESQRVAPHARDTEAADRLWDLSAQANR